jgi:pimeloyl-ACP methyl ester carboxylesterase
MDQPIAIRPYAVDVDEVVLADLRERIERTRWTVGAGSGWESGVDPEYLRSLLAYWAGEFDWREQERRLNRFHHFMADLDGAGVHFVHERGNGPNPVPIVLTHGFPSTFVEHPELVPLLTDPAAHGGRAEDVFDVVVTSLPGFGFSDPLPGPMLESTVADVWCRLMTDGLGYPRFGAHGSDAGSGVTIELGLRHAERLIGIHLSAFYLYPPPEPWPPSVREFIETSERERAEDVAYSRLQSTRPRTAAVGLGDSPAGLAAWIVDIFRSFSDCGGDVESRFTRDQLLTNITLYWATGCIGHAMHGYYDVTHFAEPPVPGSRVDVPSGFAVFADSYRPGSTRPPRELAEHFFNIARWSEMPRGGHFAALEEPELLAEDIRELFRPLRDISGWGMPSVCRNGWAGPTRPADVHLQDRRGVRDPGGPLPAA